jgi:hypothetical protein
MHPAQVVAGRTVASADTAVAGRTEVGVGIAGPHTAAGTGVGEAAAVAGVKEEPAIAAEVAAGGIAGVGRFAGREPRQLKLQLPSRVRRRKGNQFARVERRDRIVGISS